MIPKAVLVIIRTVVTITMRIAIDRFCLRDSSFSSIMTPLPLVGKEVIFVELKLADAGNTEILFSFFGSW